MMTTKSIQPALSQLSHNLPEIIPRHSIETYFPGMISKKYLQNLDAAGQGPHRYRFGGKIVYFRNDLLEWIQARLRLEI